MKSKEEIEAFISSIKRLSSLQGMASMSFKGQEIEGEVARAIENTLNWVLTD